jgi:hypothetical protein
MTEQEIFILIAAVVCLYLLIKLWRVAVVLILLGAVFYFYQPYENQKKEIQSIQEELNRQRQQPNVIRKTPILPIQPIPIIPGTGNDQNYPQNCGCLSKMEQCKSSCYSSNDRRRCHRKCEDEEVSCRLRCN